jgi:hypothetical protein
MQYLAAEKASKIIKSLGFTEESSGIFIYDSRKIVFTPEGIELYSVERGSLGEDYLESKLNFIPDKKVFLTDLIKRTFYL